MYLDGKLVDLNSDAELKIKKEFQDPEELIVKEVTYSYEMELPITARNRKILGFVDNFDVRQKFNRIYDCQIYAAEYQVFNGKFLVNEIDRESYKGNCYVPQKKELKDILGDRTLRQINPHYKLLNDWEDLTQQNNYVMGLTGYGVTYPSVDYRDDHICFPYVLYKYPYNNWEKTAFDKYTQTTKYEDSEFSLNNVFPAFNVVSVLKDMFATDGFNLIGNVFDNPKFTKLYQSYSSTADHYEATKQTPYYLKFTCDWGLRKYSSQKKKQNTSSSAEEFSDDKFRFGADIPLYSDNTTYSNIINEYEMMKTSTDTSYSKEAKTIIVPVSGWYQIRCNGKLTLPTSGGSTRGNPVTVTGYSSRDDDTSFAHSAYEFQIKRGIPKENPRYYCWNFKLPLVPVDYTENESSPSVHYNNPTAVKVLQGESCRLFGKNKATTLVKNLSGFDTSDFICGARFGHQSLHNSSSCRCEYREYNKMAMMSLYNPSKGVQKWNPGDENGGSYLYLHQGSAAGNTYGSETAQIMVRSDSYSNFEGYNLLDIIDDGAEDTNYRWDTTSNFQKKSYEGQVNSSVNVVGVTRGDFDINTCVWLEKGDTIYPEVIMAYNHNQDKCKWYNIGCKCDRRKHFYYRGITNTAVNFTFEMGLVTTEEDWIPSKANPILRGSDLQKKRRTNVNLLLPETKCNDYLNGFLNTFNCRLSQIDKNTYSIDYVSTKEEIGKTISIDEYASIEDASFKRITLPSTITMKWKIDNTEEGYVHGNNSPYCTEKERKFNKPEHSGSITFENPSNTSGSVNNKESVWSYCWYKTVKTDKGDVFQAPIISDKGMWAEEYTYELVAQERLKTDYTMRLFYLSNKKKQSGVVLLPETPYVEITGGKTFKLCKVDNCLWSYDVKGTTYDARRSLMLDFDNTAENTGDGKDTTITDNFFNFEIKDTYQLDLEMIVPNHIFRQIKSSSRILFNDSLWGVIEIDGHSVLEDQTSTVSLKSL